MMRRRVARLIVVVAAACIAIGRFLAVDSASHSVSDTLRPWAIEAAAVALAATLVIVALDRAFGGRDE